ncbi:MAG: extracellular solute-binding protein [Oscillospiraceae bacterium]|nr:extracellular solute-binding protein [Oscillospiraceae bacterium]
MKRLLIVAFLLLLVLVSCKQKYSELNKATNINAINPNATDTYRSTVLTMPDSRFEMNFQNPIRVEGDRIYIIGYLATGTDPDNPQPDIDITYSCDMSGGDLRVETSENRISSSIDFPLNDGSKIAVKYVFVNDIFDGIAVQKYSKDNKMMFDLTIDSLFAIDIKSQMSEAVMIAGEVFQIINAVQTSDDNIFMASQRKLVALSENGVKLFDIQISGEVTNLAVLTDDSVIIKYGDTRGNSYIKYVDVAAQKLGDEIKLPETVDLRNSQIVLGPGYDLYIKNYDGLYGYNIGGEPILVIDWRKSNTVSTSIQNFIVINTEKFICKTWNNLTFFDELIILDMIPKDELKERTPITLAKLYDNYQLDTYIQYFQRDNPEYYIEVIDYTKYNTQDNYQGGVILFNNEIASGKIPDIVLWGDYSGFPVESYKEKGMFRDLYELMGKDKDLLMPFAYKPFEENGKLYQFTSSVAVDTRVGKKSLFPKVPLTPSEFIDYYYSLDENQYLINTYTGNVFSARTILDFVDNEKHEVYFDSEDFIELIRFYQNNKDIEIPNFDRDERTANYRNDIMLLNEMRFIGSFDNYIQLKFQFLEDVVFVGYPTLSANGAVIRGGATYGITEKSKNAEIAWKFLKRMLEDDIQYPEKKYEFIITYAFPLTVSAMNKYIENMLKYVYIFSDNGGFGPYTKPLPEDVPSGFIVEITREEIDYILDYITNAKVINTEDYNFLWSQIIFEELQYDKTPEEIAKVIQSRAFIYINERY